MANQVSLDYYMLIKKVGDAIMQKNKQTKLKETMCPFIASELKNFRERQGLSQEAFAKKLQISLRSYSDLEHEITLPSCITLLVFMALLEKENLDMFQHTVRTTIERSIFHE